MSSLTSNLYHFGEFSLDPQSRVLKRGVEPVPLTPKAFDILLLLVQNPEEILTKDQLMRAVWRDSFVEESNLTQTIFMIRKALKETADQRYILTVQGQGYRFLAPVKEPIIPSQQPQNPLPPSSTFDLPDIQSSPRSRNLSGWRWLLLGFAAVALLFIAVFTLWPRHSRPASAEQPPKIMLAVLPFENFTGDPGQDYFSDGLTEEMISQVGNLDPSHLGVIARTSVMHYKHSQELIPEIGKDLGVQYVIEGSVRRDSARVRITAQLIQVKDQSHLWARQYDRDLSHLLELQEEIAREVANEIEFSLSGRRPIEAAHAGVSPAPVAKSYEAYDLYLKGRYFWNKRTAEEFRQAASYFQQAIDNDPNFGRAYAGLADTFSLMSTWYLGPQNELMPKARSAALRALELDDSLAEAHASLALIKENYDYDWPESEKEFRRAIQLDPQYATAHQWYAEFLSWQGRFDEAFAESEQARRLDPLSPIIATDLAAIFYNSRQYDRAVKQCRSVLELDPNFDHARAVMILSYFQLGKYGDAMEEVNRWPESGETPWVLAWKAAIYTRTGDNEKATQALAKLEPVSASRPDRAAALLIAYSGTGQKERLISFLQKEYSEHSNVVVQMKVDPLYDPVRGDPRFENLLRVLGLASAASASR